MYWDIYRLLFKFDEKEIRSQDIRDKLVPKWYLDIKVIIIL